MHSSTDLILLNPAPARGGSRPAQLGSGTRRGQRPFILPEPDVDDLSAAFRASRTAIAVADAQLRITAVNPAYAELTGYDALELLGTPLPTLRSPGERQGECTCVHRNGSVRTVWMTLAAVTDAADGVQRHVATFTDITALQRERATLQHLAQHDPLTDLPNQRHLGAELERGVARAQRHGRQLALLYVDLDHFKWVNDTLGHEAGDLLLQEVGRRLRRAVRAEDLVARVGGDEFVVLLEDARRAEDAAATAEAVLRALEPPIVVAGQRLRVSASIGIARFPDDARTAAELLRAADGAMYRVKRTGGGASGFGGLG